MEAARSGSKAEPLQDLQLGNLWTRVNLLQVVSHRTIDLHRSRLRTVAGSVIVRLLISRSSRPDFIADLFPSICIWKIWEGLEKIWEGFVSLPWFVISVLDAIFLKPTAGRVLYIFILYLTPPKSSFRPPKSDNSSPGKSTWRFWVLGTPSQLPTPFLGRSRGRCLHPGRVVVEVFTFLALPASSGQVTEQEEALQKWQMMTDDHPNDRLRYDLKWLRRWKWQSDNLYIFF